MNHRVSLTTIITIITSCFLVSCANKGLIKDVEQLMQQQITFSSDFSIIYNGKDTTLTGFTEAPIKMVVWYDSLGCSSCEVSKMYVWKDIVSYADSLSQWFSIVYLYTPKKESLRNVIWFLQADRFNYPIFIDQNSTFVKLNPKLPKNRQLHTFLLDKNNKVVMVGSPLYNPTLWELYKRTIQKMIANDGVLPEP